MKKRPGILESDFLARAGRITPAYRPQQSEKPAPCQAGCANCGDIRGWIGTIAQRSKTGISLETAFMRAWQMITEVNPFPSTLGRVCPHPCEDQCNRSEKDEPLAINAMERFLGDWAIEHEIPLARQSHERRAEWPGVIGAGPSGLSFAYQMARRGYRVTVYESRSKPGGMLRYGVPDFRLPQAILDAEIQKILDLGVELELDSRIGRDIRLEDLRKRHAALYLGIGAQKGRFLGIPGEQGSSVWTGTNYLSRLNCGDEIALGENVIVIGGGNTAVDAARSARRVAPQVTIVYRRSREEMPAAKHEIEAALDEGVQIAPLLAPVRYERGPDGALTGLLACRMRLGEKDETGRRQPHKIPDSEIRLPCDAVISAVSQQPSLAGLEVLDHEGSRLLADETGRVAEDILAGGDVLALGIAGNAIIQGRHAAEELHARFAGLEPAASLQKQATITTEQVKTDYKPASVAARPPELPVDARIKIGSAEISGTISEAQFLAETERCYSCGSCFGCEQCSMYCTMGGFTRLQEVRPGEYFSMMLDQCQECGKCVEVCPSGFLEVRRPQSN